MSTVSFHIANLLEKMTSTDKDFRFMATNDLMSELQKDSIKLDDDSERKVVRMLLKLLEDKNGEVQNLAVKCLAPLVAKVKDPNVETIVDTLCSNMSGEKEALRDISSIGLKTVITELPLNNQQLASVICKKIIGKLAVAVGKHDDVSTQLEALDITSDLLSRFGPILIPHHPMLLDSLLPQLSSPRQAVRKRTVTAIGYLSTTCSQQHYSKMIGFIVEELEKGLRQGSSNANTYIQACGIICKNSGGRFSEWLDGVCRLLLGVCQQQQGDDELRENGLQAFEIFITRCPQEITNYGHFQPILQLCTSLISHDPNYNEGGIVNEESMDTTMEDDEEDDGLGDEEDGEEDEYSDDDDMSWKVRRSAAKCIDSIITSRPDLLLYIYQNVASVLVHRFREREETVRCDVFSAYKSLLRITRPAVQSLEEAKRTGLAPDEGAVAAVRALEGQIQQLVKIVQKQLREKNLKTRQMALQLLSDLLSTLPGCLAPYLPTLLPGVSVCLSPSSTSHVRTTTLQFLHSILSTHPSQVLQPHIESILQPLLVCASDNFYKVTSEALNTIQVLIRVVMENQSSVAGRIYPSILRRLTTTDIDQEVKESSISAMACLFSYLGAYIAKEWEAVVPVFLERLKNEITRLTAVKAINQMAGSGQQLDMSKIVIEGVPLLAGFLRKNQRGLKLASLGLLETLVRRFGPLPPQLLDCITNELPPLLSESDLHVAQQALYLMGSMNKYQTEAVERVAIVCMPSVRLLARSPLMQGSTLTTLLSYLDTLVVGSSSFTPSILLQLFMEQDTSCSKQSYYSLAKCIAVIAVGAGQALEVSGRLVSDLSQKMKNDGCIIIGLLSVGEIGRRVDLSPLPTLHSTLLSYFHHQSEEVKTAASYAYGSVAIGNLEAFLPVLLKEMELTPKRQYLLLHALKEIISTHPTPPAIAPYINPIWSTLFKHAECPEEGTRNVVAECLGRLTLAQPSLFLPHLDNALNSESSLLRTTVVTAVKFTITDQPQLIDPLLKERMGRFLKSIEDPDLNVRRVALVAFNSAAHNKAVLVRDLLGELLPRLYRETEVRKDLIREVEMGPFKHSVDDGLDLRKAAFECMYTLLDSCLDRLDIREFLTHVESGLRDHYDIKMLTYLMLSRLAVLTPQAVLQRLDRLIEPLKNTVTLKVKANSVKQEYEKQDELKRAALRAVVALGGVQEADKHILLMEFIAHIRSSPELLQLYESVQSDGGSLSTVSSAAAVGGESMFVE